jgi:hypothetical protein
VGLSLTSSSIFQMLRGSVVIFTTALSYLALGKKVQRYHAVGVVLVLAGTAVVGLSSTVCVDACAGGSGAAAAGAKAMTGNVLIIVAQVIVAVQMVVEQKFIDGYDIPALQVVGMEGAWGLSFLTVALAAMYAIPTAGTPLCAPATGPNATDTSACGGVATFSAEGSCAHVEDAYDAAVQIGHAPVIALYTVLNVASIGFFNFFGVSVTKHVDAATRMVLDSCRTMVIWGVSLGLGWEKFCYMQVIGFALLASGTVIYNRIVELRLCGVRYDDDGAAAAVGEAPEAALLAAGAEEEGEAELSLQTYAIKGARRS